jgi:hypothetical protein
MKIRKRFVLMFVVASALLVQIVWQPFEQPRLRQKLIDLAPQMETIFRYFNFDRKDALNQWEEKVFHGRVAYWVDFDQNDGFVHSKSEGSASAIFRRLQYDLYKNPYLAWKWRIGQFPKKNASSDPLTQDDYGARVYVVFPSIFFTNIECIEYLWDEHLPEGTVRKSPYSTRIKQYVIQSGSGNAGQWVSEQRNVIEDYKLLFDKAPKKKVAAIALMTDADSGGSEAEAFFDDIQIGAAATQ